MAREPQPPVAQLPVGLLGLVRQELAEETKLEVEQAWMEVLMLEEEVGQVVKKVPPSSSS